MRNRFAMAAPALAAALVLGACQEPTTPTAPTVTSVDRPFASSSGSDTPCTGTLTGTFDNVVVPPGATCQLLGATVLGNVKALENSRLVINGGTVHGNVQGDKAATVQLDAVVVRQHVEIKDGGPSPGFEHEVAICRTTVLEGNIHVEKMRGDFLIGGPDPEGVVPTVRAFEGGPGVAPQAAPCLGNDVRKGNVFLQENIQFAFVLGVYNNVVGSTEGGGNLQVFKNTGEGFFPKEVQGNTVAGNIQCFENSPPFVGGPNTAPKKEGQCF